MKILAISESYPTRARPYSGLFVHKLFQGLTKEGHEILVISPRAPSLFKRGPAHLDKNIDTHSLDVIRLSRRISAPGLLQREANKIAERIIKLIEKKGFRPDVIYAHFANAGHIAAEVSSRTKTPFALMLGDSSLQVSPNTPNAEDRNRSMVTALRSASVIMCVSKKLLNEASLYTERTKLHHVPNGVELSRFQSQPMTEARNQLGLPTNAIIAGFTGTLNSRKGASTLYRLQREVNPTFKLALATASHAEVTEGVVFQSFIPPADLPTFLSACDFFLFPTKAEGMSNALLEAMSCGRLIVTSDTDFNREFLDNSNAVLLDFTDTETSTAELSRVVANLEEYKDRGDKAKSDSQKFSLSVRVETVHRLLEETFLKVGNP